jgi:uncharacterized protein YjiS (DUF1127 family)
MMTQPIQMFENLTSETSPAGGNASKITLSFNDRRAIEMRARYARAELLANGVADAIIWVARQYKRLAAALKEDFELRAAEAQLSRMSDRELADLGLCRADIPFAVREATGVAPYIDVSAGHAGSANQNLRSAA